MHDSMYMDSDIATDPKMEVFVLMEPCSNLCCTICVNGCQIHIHTNRLTLYTENFKSQ